MNLQGFLQQFHLSRSGSLSLNELIDTVRRRVKGEATPAVGMDVALDSDTLSTGKDGPPHAKGKGELLIFDLLGEGAFGKVCNTS